MERKNKPIEATRESLLRVITATAVEKSIPKRNDDVTKFLNELDKCEEKAKEIKFQVK